jgi:Leucine-rich repeat (LRR) protein
MDFSSQDLENLAYFPFKDYIHTLLKLNLSQNNLVQFPQELFNLKVIEEIKLDYNYIQYLPSQIGNLKSLQCLSFLSNRLLSLPHSLYSLKKLQILNVAKNNIRVIDASITALESLSTLHIYSNCFTELPSVLYKLKNLTELGLDWLKYTEPSYDMIIRRYHEKEIFLKVIKAFKSMKDEGRENLDVLDFFAKISTKELDVCRLDIRKRNVLHRAAADDDPGLINFLGRIYPQLINQLDEEGHTPLTISLVEGKYKISY